MKINRLITILLCFITTQEYMYAQYTGNQDELLIQQGQEKIATLTQMQHVLTEEASHVVSAELSNVFIQQIGNKNSINANIQSEFIDLQLFQTGSGNHINLEETSLEVSKKITQIGNDNTIMDMSFNPLMSTNLELIQEGNDLNFERFGSNELSNNLKFKMTGTSKTILIRSF